MGICCLSIPERRLPHAEGLGCGYGMYNSYMLVDPLMTVWGLNTSTEAFIVILSLCASTFPSGQSSLPYNSAQSLPTQRHGHRFYRPAALPATRVNHRQATPRLSSLSRLQN